MADPADTTKCIVLYGNRLQEDILCKRELDEFGTAHPDKCKIVYTLTKPESDWDGEVGRIGTSLIERHSPLDMGEGKRMALICGPGGLEKAVHRILAAAGWNDRDILFF